VDAGAASGNPLVLPPTQGRGNVASMGVCIGAGLSIAPDHREAAADAARVAAAGLGGAPCDLAVVFASGGHLAAPEAALEAAGEVLEPGGLVGCGAGGVIGAGQEIEDGTAVAVWAAALDGGEATTFRAVAEPIGESSGAVVGMPDLSGAAGVLLLADPYSFPTDAVLRELTASIPGVPVVGGIASARTLDGAAALFHDGELAEEGAVGVRLDGIELLPCVSQGAAPVGPELTITAGEGHVVAELAGKPALEKLRETVTQLPERERALLERGLLLGIVIDPNKPDYVQGDFLVRGIVGVDQETGSLAVSALVRPGQVVRLHARDAASADRDLRDALGTHRIALGARGAAGALLFSCNGRGSSMFGTPGHDAQVLASELGGIPAAGFFAAGEIGPVGGEHFLHGFTATVAVFAA
jgi:small ligand-binding sensory domain FIST